MAIWKKNLGDKHPDVAIGLNTLGQIYEAQRRYGEAEPLYIESIEILEKTLGADHPNTRLVKENYERFRKIDD